jgi:hypothetical protein
MRRATSIPERSRSARLSWRFLPGWLLLPGGTDCRMKSDLPVVNGIGKKSAIGRPAGGKGVDRVTFITCAGKRGWLGTRLSAPDLACSRLRRDDPVARLGNSWRTSSFRRLIKSRRETSRETPTITTKLLSCTSIASGLRLVTGQGSRNGHGLSLLRPSELVRVGQTV